MRVPVWFNSQCTGEGVRNRTSHTSLVGYNLAVPMEDNNQTEDELPLLGTPPTATSQSAAQENVEITYFG